MSKIKGKIVVGEIIVAKVKELIDYVDEGGDIVNYVIMSYETMRAIPSFENSNNSYPQIFGVPVAMCNNLAFGEIEIV